MELSIIIVNWNTRDPLLGCLRSVYGTLRGLQAEVIVVDNASTDGSVDAVLSAFPQACLVASQHNLGFAAANNRALPRASGRMLLLLNPDTLLTDGAVVSLAQVLDAHPIVGIAGAQLLNRDGTPQMSCGVYPSLWTELPAINRRLKPVRQAHPASESGARLAAQSVDWVSGACLMIKRVTYEAIGPLDESFWLYTEEADWCYRARKAGWDVLLVPDARVYHMARAASGQRFVFTMLHFYQSRVRFARKHYGSAHAWSMKQILRLKAAVWCRQPGGSPLCDAYPGLSDEQIMAAYQKLSEALSLPIEDFLQANWQ